MANESFEASIPGIGFVKSPCGIARNGKSGKLAQFQIIIGVCPIWGFGTFAADSVAGGLDYNTTWPKVFTTLTETLVLTGFVPDPGTYTRISTWSQNADVQMTVDSSGWDAEGLLPPGPLTISADGTTATATYDWTGTIPPGSGPTSGPATSTYTAVLSGAFSDWAGATATALGLLGNATLPAIMTYTGGPDGDDQFPTGQAGDDTRIQCVVPVSSAVSASGWAILDTLPGAAIPGNFTLVCAAAYGLGIQFTGNADGFNETTDWPNYICANTIGAAIVATGGAVSMTPTVADNPYGSFASGLASPPFNNMGCVVCLSSRWALNGQGIGTAGGLFADTTHSTVVGQKMTVSGSTLSIGGAIQPASFQTPGQVSANGTLYANPLYKWEKDLVFLASDVGTNLYASGATAPYGLLGFWPTPH